MGLPLRERERQERILRLQHLLRRAADEEKALGNRGGQYSRDWRAKHMRDWEGELKRLTLQKMAVSSSYGVSE